MKGGGLLIDTLVALLNFFFLTSDACLDIAMLTAADTSRHIVMTHTYVAIHFADTRTLGKDPSEPHFVFFPFTLV